LPYIISGATHTRFDHALEAMEVARREAKVLKKKGRLPCPMNDIMLYTLIHDAGHGPLSHAFEYPAKEATGLTHNERALLILDSPLPDMTGKTFADATRLAGGDVEFIRKLLKGHPASAICKDKTLGADKLAYTSKDASYCGFDQLPPLTRQHLSLSHLL